MSLSSDLNGDHLASLLTRVTPDPDPFVADPVTIEAFLLGKTYANQSEWAWPAIVEELKAIFGDNPREFANQEAILKWAVGAGKSFLVSAAFAYMLYWTLNLKDPQRYLNQAPDTTIVWINQSINEDQAKRVIFHEVSNRVEQSPWFRDHGYLPDPKIKSELRFPKDIVVFPGNSRMEFPAGYALLGGVIDEAAHFTEPIPGSEKQDPAEFIRDSMIGRIRTRFSRRGLLLVISSPKHAEDFIERSYAFAKYGNPAEGVPPPPRTYASQKALWDTKPGHDKDQKTGQWIPYDMVPFEQAQVDPTGRRKVIFRMMVPDLLLPNFLRNPEEAKRNYAAIATRTGAGFFADPDVVARPRMRADAPGFNPSRFHPFTDEMQMHPSFRWPHEAPGVCFFHVDLARTRDACGLAVGHVGGTRQIAGERKPLIIVDLMLEIKAPPDGEIDFQEVRNLIYLLQGRGFPIQYGTYDGWQSVDSIQQMRKKGIEAEVLSVDRDTAAYDTFKEAVYEGRLDYYQYQPLYDCVKSLVLIRGSKVDHTITGKKDVSDAVAGICQTLTERWMTGVTPAAGSVTTAVSASVSGRRVRRGHAGRRAGVA